MVLIETMGSAWTIYRQGMVYAIQHKQYDSAIAFLHGMWSMLPMKDRKWYWHDLGIDPRALIDTIGKTNEEIDEIYRIIMEEKENRTPHDYLPKVPMAFDLISEARGDVAKKKILWINRAVIIIENAISKWVHHNIDRASFN